MEWMIVLELQPDWQATNCVCKQCTCEFTKGSLQRFADTCQKSSGSNSIEDFLTCTFFNESLGIKETPLSTYELI